MTRIIAVIALVFATPLAASEDELAEALGLDRLIPIMRAEGIAHGEDIRDQMFPREGGGGWEKIVATIYDADAMERRVEVDFAGALEDRHVAPLLQFFKSDLGARIVQLEMSAREAMLDPDIEAEAEARVAAMAASKDARLALLERFVESNELVETNVEGALNASYGFYQGLLEGGYDGGLTEGQVIADVYAQEPMIRGDTMEWVYSYLALAYGPLSDAELNEYVAFSRTEAGQALNDALFLTFNDLYGDISRSLGSAAARFMSGEDI